MNPILQTIYKPPVGICVYAPPSLNANGVNKEKNKDKNDDPSTICDIDVYIQNELRTSNLLRTAYPLHSSRRFFLPTAAQRTGKSSIVMTYPSNPEYLHLYLARVGGGGGTRDFMYELMDGYTHLLESLQCLSDAKVAHGHIQLTSIVMHPSGVPMLADFSMAMQLRASVPSPPIDVGANHTPSAPPTITLPQLYKQIQRMVQGFEPENIYRPIELQLLSYMQTNKLPILSAYHINWVIDQIFADTHPVLGGLYRNWMHTMRASARQQYATWANRSFRDLLETEVLLRENARLTWDVYGLHIAYLGIIGDIHRQWTGRVKSSFLTGFIRLLAQAVHPSPDNRPTAGQAFAQWNHYVRGMTSSDYSQFIYRN